MGVGRFICVGIPFALTLASLICLLIATLAGVTDKSLYLFEADTQNLSISSSELLNLASELSISKRSISDLTLAALNPSTTTSSAESAASSALASALGTDGATNITASDLDLADSYKVSLWGYCATTGSNTTCTKAKFDWAATALNTTTIDSVSSATGVNVTLPADIRSALKTFKTVSKWTQVVYIIAIIATAIEMVLSLFAFCSRIASCITWVISGISSAATIAASIMATVLASVTTAAIKSSAKAYGVKGSINTHFLAVTWLAVAFSIASGFFWVFTICCCASDHHKNPRNKNRDLESEKLMPTTGAYQRVQEPTPMDTGYHGQEQAGYHGQQQGVYNPQFHQNQPTRTGAYEPYAHAAI